MSDLEQYDAAANKFYSTQSFTSLPLTSWDFYTTIYKNTRECYNDIVQLKRLSKTNEWAYLVNFSVELFQKKYVIVITDPKLNIVHATQNIETMNGYLPEEIVGAKPNMFQGADTCKKTTNTIRMAVQKAKRFEATVLNYRKDGTAYNCWIKGEPIFNTSGKLVNFIAFEKEVA